MPFMIKHGGSWKSATPWVRSGGVWKQATAHVRTGGVWKAANGTITLSMNPGDQYWSDISTSHWFSPETIDATGGTPSAYAWGFIDPLGGSWSFNGATNGATATPVVEGVSSVASATVYCDVTTPSGVQRVTAYLEYSNTSGGNN